MAIYFFYGCLSSAQINRWQAPTQQPIIDKRPVEQTAYRRETNDHGYKSVFTNSWLVRQRNRSWIKELGKNPQKSELVHWWQCLLSGATEPWTHGFRETIACIQVKCHDGTPWMACWQGSRQNTQKSECAFRHSNRLFPKILRVHTTSDANWLTRRCEDVKITFMTPWRPPRIHRAAHAFMCCWHRDNVKQNGARHRNDNDFDAFVSSSNEDNQTNMSHACLEVRLIYGECGKPTFLWRLGTSVNLPRHKLPAGFFSQTLGKQSVYNATYVTSV